MNAVPKAVFTAIFNHINRFTVKRTHFGARKKLYLDARLCVKDVNEKGTSGPL